METVPGKSWTSPIASSKKYLSRMFTHKLARHLSHDNFEVLFESPLKVNEQDEPDVVVFDKRKGWCSVMAIEICNTEEITDMLIIARGLMDKFSLLDFFLYDQQTTSWYNIKKGSMGYEVSSNTNFMGVELDHLKD